MPITIRDIARELDLSIAAVSRALGGYADISEETRQRVIETARRMGYVPNRAARQLRRQKAEAVGYVLPSQSPRFADPFFTEFIAGLGDATACLPFDLTISIAPPGEEAEKHLYQSWVQSRKVDGFILTHLRIQDWRIEYLLAQGIPFSALESVPGQHDYPRLDIDRQAGVVELLAHLTARGFRRIAMIGGPTDLQIHASHLAGYLQGLNESALQFEPYLIVPGDLTSSGGFQATQELFTAAQPPDAIVCINDETAFGSLHALRQQGLHIGREVAVAGFDGVAMSAHSDPPLTTLDIPVYEIAGKLVAQLAARLENAPGPGLVEVITPRLLMRASTGDTGN